MCTCLWRVELECTLNAGTGAGQHDTRVALEALSAAVDERDHGARLRLALGVVLQQVDQHTVDPASSQDRVKAAHHNVEACINNIKLAAGMNALQSDRIAINLKPVDMTVLDIDMFRFCLCWLYSRLPL